MLCLVGRTESWRLVDSGQVRTMLEGRRTGAVREHREWRPGCLVVVVDGGVKGGAAVLLSGRWWKILGATTTQVRMGVTPAAGRMEATPAAGEMGAVVGIGRVRQKTKNWDGNVAWVRKREEVM